jgi:hypothetical protein
MGFKKTNALASTHALRRCHAPRSGLPRGFAHRFAANGGLHHLRRLSHQWSADSRWPQNNLIAAVSERASWGYFDFRMKGESFADGFQSVPVDWTNSSARKRGFFRLPAEMAGEGGN